MAGATTDLLEQVPLFRDLEHKELEQIAGSMKKRTFAAGDIVTAAEFKKKWSRYQGKET